MTLDEVTKQFEARFERVVEFDPKQESPRHAPGGNNEYFTVTSSGPKTEGASPRWFFPSPESAVDAWLTAALANLARYPNPTTLYWRTKPDMSEGRAVEDAPEYPLGKHVGPTLYTVYSRMTFG